MLYYKLVRLFLKYEQDWGFVYFRKLHSSNEPKQCNRLVHDENETEGLFAKYNMRSNKQTNTMKASQHRQTSINAGRSGRP